MVHITDYPCFHEKAYYNYNPGDNGGRVYDTAIGRVGAARDPDDRFASAAAYLEALRAARRAGSRGPRQWLRQLFRTR